MYQNFQECILFGHDMCFSQNFQVFFLGGIMDHSIIEGGIQSVLLKQIAEVVIRHDVVIVVCSV